MIQTINRPLVYIITLLLLFYPIKKYSQEVDQKSTMLISAMEKAHVSPIGINNELSNRIHSLFIESIDENGLYFLESDILFFNNFKDSIDDQILEKNNIFFKIVRDTLYRRQQQINEHIATITENNLKFDKSDSVIFDNSTLINYSKSFNALNSRWTKYIKWNALSYFAEKTNDNKLLSEKEIRETLEQGIYLTKEELNCEHEYMNDQQNFDGYLLDAFLNSITMSYDPHSVFFNEPIKESFEESLSSNLLSFGVYFYKENKVFKVHSLTPGSEAWQTGLINIDDQLVNLQLPDSSMVNFGCLTSEDLDYLLSNPNLKQIKIKIKKQNGEFIELALHKNKIKNNDNVITSLIIEGQSKIGYISLPSFYQNFEDSSIKGCANDFAKEIFKLKKDSIKGLVIDLRFNGGGSLKEATDLAGIFIDVGILGFIKGQSNPPYLIKDFNRGRAYSGPLVVMINGASASASEVFAGTLQNYNRAIIVGNKSFGKSTGQTVLPLDTTLWSIASTSNSGILIEDYIKVTNGKLYHVNQSNHQIKGIDPDIYIPSIWESYFDSEADYSYSIPNDSINKKVNYKPYSPIPMEVLASKSKNRINNDSIFQFIKRFSDSLIPYSHNKTVYLTPKLYTQYSKLRSKNSEFISKKIKVKNSYFSYATPVYYKEVEQMNNLLKKRNTRLKKRLKEDVELNEAFYIITDYINQINNTK